MKSTLTIRIPADIRTELRTLSKLEHIPMSDLVRESLRRYIAVCRFRRLRGKILPFAQTRGLLTDEDVFNFLS